MERNKKVIWYEGMTLDPHHFQQWDRFHQSTLAFRIRSIVNNDWGVTELNIDKEALTNGQFKILSCKGVMPDGLTFQLPESDPLPKALVIDQKSFPAADESLSVYLAIPSERLHSSNCLLPGAQSGVETRFKLETLDITDDTTGKDEREIGIARANFQLRFGNEALEDYSAITIAEVIRTSAGAYELNNKFIPSSLSISASEYLLDITRELLELLITERALKWRQRRQPSGQNEFTTSDAHVLGYLNTINYYIPILNHEHTQKKCHPETLYKFLLSLAGQLTTFSTASDIHPRDFPRYDHSNLSNGFNKLDNIIRSLLRVEIQENYSTIALEKHGESLYMGELDENHVSQGTMLLLMVSCEKNDIAEKKIIDELPKNLKISDKEKIRILASSATTGLKISYTPRPPVGLPSQPGMHYFRLDKAGEFWDFICQNHNIAFLVAGDLKTVNLKLVAVFPSQ